MAPRQSLTMLAMMFSLAFGMLAQQPVDQRAIADSDAPAYKPDPALAGQLHLVGTDTMKDLLDAWVTDFTAVQPNVAIDVEAKGALTAAPALTGGTADIAPLSREMTPIEIDRFKAKYGYEPTPIRVGLGSYNTSGKTVALALFVNQANPLRQLNFTQLDAIFCSSLRRGASRQITRWGQLGLTGEWENREIHLVGVKVPDGISNFIRLRLCDGGTFRAGIHEENTGGTVNVLDRIVSLIAADPAAIGYGGFDNLKPGTRQLAIAEDSHGPYLRGTFDEVASARYPLTRYIYLYVNLPPGKPLAPATLRFLSYVLSREGQSAVERDGTLLPLPDGDLKSQIKILADSKIVTPDSAQEVIPKEALHAPVDPALPHYKPVAHLAGTLRSLGSDTMDDLMKPWADAFHAIYPDVTITVESKASMSVPSELTSGAAQLAPLSRELNPEEIEAFRAKNGSSPTETRVALGSYRTPTRTVALTFYVNDANPIRQLTFAQLDAMWCTMRKRGFPTDVTTWGDLGLTGEWASRPIHLVGVLPPDGVPNFISRVVCQGGPFRDGILTEKNAGTGSVLTRIVQHIAQDPDAIGYAGFHNQLPKTKHIPISETDSGPYLEGTFDEVRTARYPLTRFVNIYSKGAHGEATDNVVAEFFRFILSREGQAIVEQEGVFMPLPANVADAERARIH